MTRDERLRELVSIVNGIHFGMPGYDQRLAEMSSGFSARGDGGGAKGAVSRPVESMLGLNRKPPVTGEPEDPSWGFDDPAAKWKGDFEKKLESALRAAEELWHEYKRVAQPRLGVTKLNDPGCELCAVIPCGCDRCKAFDGPHYCDTYGTIDHTEPAKKGRKAMTRKLKLCSSCYSFQRPDRAGRLPTHDEVLDHAEGRKRRWKVGA